MTNGRILLIDQDASARNTLAERLRGAGFIIETAGDDVEALGKLGEFAPDLVLADLDVPGSGGVELLRKLQECDSSLAVVLMAPSGRPRIPGATLDELERYAILKTVEANGGSTAKAAEVLGISVRKIQYKLQEYAKAPKRKGARVAIHASRESEPETMLERE
jgi:DNA-binding NtrC family response regulator